MLNEIADDDQRCEKRSFYTFVSYKQKTVKLAVGIEQTLKSRMDTAKRYLCAAQVHRVRAETL